MCLCLFQARHSGRSGCRQARPMRATRATFIRPGHRSYFADSRDWQRPPVVRRWQSVDGFYISAGVFVACAISWPIFFPKLGVSNGGHLSAIHPEQGRLLRTDLFVRGSPGFGSPVRHLALATHNDPQHAVNGQMSANTWALTFDPPPDPARGR